MNNTNILHSKKKSVKKKKIVDDNEDDNNIIKKEKVKKQTKKTLIVDKNLDNNQDEKIVIDDIIDIKVNKIKEEKNLVENDILEENEISIDIEPETIIEGVKLYKIPLDECEDFLITIDSKVWNKKKKRYMKTRLINGYYNVTIKKNNYAISRLNAITFKKNPENKPYVDHINDDKICNENTNLQWVTQKENLAKNKKKIYHEKKVKGTHVVTGEVVIYDQVTLAANAIGGDKKRRGIQLVLTGQNKTCANYKWEYVDPENNKIILSTEEKKKAKNIPGSSYFVFPNGKIYNELNKQYLKPVINDAQRSYVTLIINGEKKNYYVSRVVAECHLENRPYDDSLVEHINKKSHDNDVENLRWSDKRQHNVNVIFPSKKIIEYDEFICDIKDDLMDIIEIDLPEQKIIDEKLFNRINIKKKKRKKVKKNC